MENLKDKGDTIVEQENQIIDDPSHDVALITEVKDKPYHPIFPGMDFEKTQAVHTKVPTGLLLLVLVICFFGIKAFIYIRDSKRDGR